MLEKKVFTVISSIQPEASRASVWSVVISAFSLNILNTSSCYKTSGQWKVKRLPGTLYFSSAAVDLPEAH